MDTDGESAHLDFNAAKRDKQLRGIFERAKMHSLPSRLQDLNRLTVSDSDEDRLLALLLVRRNLDEIGHDEEYFDFARPMISDSNNNCRWQAMIVLGAFIDSMADQVWEVVLEYGNSPDEDMRTAVATVLLEHLLDNEAGGYETKAEKLAATDHLFADTLNKCWTFSEDRPQ